MTDYWITDPPGHRKLVVMPKVGDTMHGIPIVAVLDPGDEWICDLCNATCFVGDEDETWPVAVIGGNGLCVPCTQEVGVYPTSGCGCPPCRRRWIRWRTRSIA